MAVRISYRRTLEQLQAVVNATSPEALYSLLADALDEGRTELAVRIGYWGEDGQARVEDAMAQLREERELTETIPWVVNYYPAEAERPGLVEFLLDPPEPPETKEDGELPGDGEEGKEGELPENGEEGAPVSGEEAPPEDAETNSEETGGEEGTSPEAASGEAGAEP